jgi:hypothetical protein
MAGVFNMNTAEKIFEEVRTLPESVAREVLDFVGYLKSKRAEHPKVEAADMSEFDQFGAVFDGKFNRDECYDRKVLR